MKKKILSRFQQSSLNKKIVYVTLTTFCAAFLVCLLTVMFFFTTKEQEENKQLLLDTYNRIDAGISNYLDELDMSAYTVMCSKWVQQLLGGDSFSVSDSDQTEQKNASHFMSSYASMNGNLNCLLFSEEQDYIKSNNSIYVSQGFDIREQEWYDQLMRDGQYLELEQSSVMAKNSDKPSLTAYYVVKSIYNFKPLGYFVVHLSYEQLEFISSLLSEQESVLIQNHMGATVYCSMDSKKFWVDFPENVEGIYIDNKRMVYEDSLMNGQWKIWIMHQNTPLTESIQKHFYVFLIVIPVIMICILISVMLSRYLTIPIVRCTEAFKEVRNQNFDYRIANEYKDEIGDMLEGFNDMTGNIKNLLEQIRLMYEAHQQAELKILQQRMDPHFLCNTLEIMNGMILMGDNDQAIELSAMLGKMYQYDLGEEDIVDVKEELSYLKNYLDILSYKYRKLHVIYDIDEEALEYPLMKFICQPLAENAVKHGFLKRTGECIMKISIKMEEMLLHIIIEDNGGGIEAELLGELRRKIDMLKKNQATEINNYIGVLNTARRIFLQYGDTCIFDIESEEGKGTKIEIIMPVENGGG